MLPLQIILANKTQYSVVENTPRKNVIKNSRVRYSSQNKEKSLEFIVRVFPLAAILCFQLIIFYLEILSLVPKIGIQYFYTRQGPIKKIGKLLGLMQLFNVDSNQPCWSCKDSEFSFFFCYQ